MTEARTQRLRDPVHGLIVFEVEREPLDRLAWQLLDTPEFQRLRRIRQLGVSEFVFPGATHTRLAHCVGVFHTARQLAGIIGRALGPQDFDEQLAAVAQIAALLHDLGHGPFSHTFEGVQRSRGVSKRHEKWTAEIVRNSDGRVRPLLEVYAEGFCEQVAALLEAEDPADIYHAIVSSSFDADRLDYLRRDRLMTGTGAGAIDFDWLLENLRVREIEIDAPDPEAEHEEEERLRVQTFCLDAKALPAAEQFLLARFTLHDQVYFHKTTRCVEHMIAKLLSRVAKLARNKRDAPKQVGLDRDHPLLRFFTKNGETLENYLALDDVVVMGAIERMTTAADADLAELARRLRERRLYKTLDLQTEFGRDAGRQRKEARRIDRQFAAYLNDSVLKDESAAIGIYTQIGGDDEREHKKLHILDGGKPVEITEVSELIHSMREKKRFTRYYFADEADRDSVRRR